jgi:hypothetical protein
MSWTKINPILKQTNYYRFATEVFIPVCFFQLRRYFLVYINASSSRIFRLEKQIGVDFLIGQIFLAFPDIPPL